MARVPTAYTDISGEKTWLFEDGVETAKPGYIVVELLRDGQPVEKRTVLEATGWKYTFADLPVDDGYGHTYEYAIREAETQGFFPLYKGNDICNIRLPENPEQENFETFLEQVEAQFGTLSEQELEKLMSLFDYKAPHAGLLPTGERTPWWVFLSGTVGLMALMALAILEKRQRRS